MTNEQAALKLSLHLFQCGMLMPIKWLEANGKDSDTAEAFRLAIAALRAQDTPNPPLTLEELRWMNGEPVYIADLSYGSLRTGWKIFDWHDDDCFFTHWKGMFRAGTYGVDWLAYRRKPEGEK